MLKYFIFFLSFYCSIALAVPRFVPYTQHGLNLTIPEGWHVTVDSNQGNSVTIEEDPDDPKGAALLFLTFPSQAVPNAEMLAQLNRQLITQIAQHPRVLAEKDFDSSVDTIARGKIEGISAKMAVISKKSTPLSIGIFIAPTERFGALGGVKLLYVTFFGEDPKKYFEDSSPQPQKGIFCKKDYSDDYVPYDKLNVIDSVGRYNCIIAHSKQPSSKQLIGEWMDTIAYHNPGVAWRNNSSGAMSYSSQSRGYQFQFNRDGSYLISYLFKSHYGCSSESAGQEVGRYQLNEKRRQLTLIPSYYETTLRMCGGAPSKMGKKRAPTEKFVIGIHPEQALMALRLRCRDYEMDCPQSGFVTLILARTK